MLEKLKLFRLTFKKREFVVIAASSMIEALQLSHKLPDFEVGEVMSITDLNQEIFV